MSEALYPYYERELSFLRHFARRFAERYPAAAGRLLLDASRSADPHVERMMEGFALLAGRIHHKLDDEYPELTDALLSILHPHYLAPLPSMAIVELEPAPALAEANAPYLLPRGAMLRCQPVGGVPCRFRTTAAVELCPVKVARAGMRPPPFPPAWQAPTGTVAVLRLELETLGTPTFSQLKLDRLRFHLAGEEPLTAELYELLLHHALRVDLLAPEATPATGRAAPSAYTRAVLDPAEVLRAGGFGRDEAMLPAPPAAHPAYRLLTEFFAFPSKFLFVELGGLSAL
ncbi:MAG: type VI secretion system baseplate subunit TssF, partial [Planctomycetia bacterium]